MKNIFLAFTIFTLATIGADAQSQSNPMPFSYRVLAPENSSSCQSTAQAIAQRFTQATNAKVISSQCADTETILDHGQTFKINVIDISYLSLTELKPYRAVFSGDTFMDQPLGGAGVFAQYPDCLQAMNQQKQVFESSTGLVLVSGHCEASTDSNPSYFFSLESFGTPMKRLFSYQDNVDFYIDPLIHSTALSEISNAGGIIALNNSSQVFYFSEQPISIMTQELGVFDSPDLCALQQQDAENIYASDSIKNVTILCAKNDDSKTPRSSLTVVGIYGNEPTLRTEATTYSSLRECLGDKSRVINNYISGSEKILGALCRPDVISSNFVLDTYFP